MRLATTLLLAGLFLTTSCMGSSSLADDDVCEPKFGSVLSACCDTGTIVVSLGSKDGVRPGQAVTVARDGKLVTEVIIHEVNDTQSVGTAFGQASDGGARPGDKVIVPQ